MPFVAARQSVLLLGMIYEDLIPFWVCFKILTTVSIQNNIWLIGNLNKHYVILSRAALIVILNDAQPAQLV